MKPIIAIAAAFALAGCSSLIRPTTSTQAIVVPAGSRALLTTNTPSPVVVTNTVQGAPVVVTNYAPPIILTNWIATPAHVETVIVTNWIPNPTITAGIQAAGAANSAFNPTPSAPLVTWGLAGLSAALSLYAGYKNKQTGIANSLVNTVTTAVETYPGPGLDAVKQHIAGVSAMLGTSAALDAAVQKTAATVAPAVPKSTT